MNRKLSHLILLILVVLSFALRVFRISEPGKYYYDEVYHVVTARAYSQNNPAAYDPFAPPPEKGTAFDWLHPPLAKLIQAGSIKIIGDKPLGWRLPSAIFGTGIIVATFFLAYVLFGPTAAVFASFVIAFENLIFVMSRITMNDVFVTFFVIVSFIFAHLYIKASTGKLNDSGQARMTGEKRYLILTSIFLGLAAASKWTGAYAIVAISFYLLINKLKTKKFDFSLILILLIPPLIYISSYAQYFMQGHSFINGSDIVAFINNVGLSFNQNLTPGEINQLKKPYVSDFAKLHQQIWWYQNRHDLEHSYGTTPLYCVPKGLNGPKKWCPWILNVRGVYFSYEQYGDKAGFIYALGNPLIFWSGVLAVSYCLGLLIEQKKKEYVLLLLGYFVFWIPWIFSPRIMFLYHYLPAIPFLSISIGVVLASIWKTKFKYISVVVLVIFAAAFFYFYPITSGWPVDPKSIDQKTCILKSDTCFPKYMWLKTWR